jgi:hypothetical protein
LLETAKSSGPKGKLRLFIPILRHIGVDISFEQNFNPKDIAKKIMNFIHGGGPMDLKLKEGDEPKKLKD